MLSLTDPGDNTTTFHYDALHRLDRETDPLGQARTFGSDELDRRVTATDRDGRRRDFHYDELNQLDWEKWYDTGDVLVETLTYTFDAAGRLLTATNAAGTVTQSYDALGRLESSAQPAGLTLTYGHDAADNRTSVQDSAGGATTSVYDLANRLTERAYSDGQAELQVDLSYTVRDKLAGVVRWGDVSGTLNEVGRSGFTYDPAGRLTDLLHLDGGGQTLADYAYGYDAADRLTSEDRDGVVTPYTYDTTNQLTGDGQTAYSYDDNGNRTMTGYQTGDGNRLTTDGVWTYSYDDEGNLIGKVSVDGLVVWEYDYDHRNHMTEARKELSDGTPLTVASYAYDALDRRVVKAVWTQASGTTTVTQYAFDGIDVYAELDGDDAVQVRYLRGDEQGQLFAEVTVSGVSWPLQDRLGSVRDVTDGDGVVVDQIGYNGFGLIISESNPAAGGNVKYAGYLRDGETGFYATWQRHYDPSSGRWLQQDPIGFKAEDVNLYRYVQNSATLAHDPTGLWEIHRNFRARAVAVPQVGDSIQSLADQTGLVASEALGDNGWLKPMGKLEIAWLDRKAKGDANYRFTEDDLQYYRLEFTVPNTAYIDVGFLDFVGLAIHRSMLLSMKEEIDKHFKSSGLNVMFTPSNRLTADLVREHLRDKDLYKYAYIGHGSGGALTSIGKKEETVQPGRYTPFRIPELQVIGCFTNDAANSWRENVAPTGLMVTVQGLMRYSDRSYVVGIKPK